MNPPALLERDASIAAVRAALAGGRNLLVHGPPGVGKTALLRAALVSAARRPLLCSAATFAGLHREICAALSVPRSRPQLEQALAAASCCLVWDPAPFASRVCANAVRDLLRCSGTPLLATAASAHMETIGYLSIFFTLLTERLRLAPLSDSAVRQLARAELSRSHLLVDDPDDLIAHVVPWSRGCPGRLLAMLDMARQPRYRRGGQVKLNLIHLDLTAGPPPAAGLQEVSRG
ncbi:MAG: AAA family ATPase [Terriglobales bacterium]